MDPVEARRRWSEEHAGPAWNSAPARNARLEAARPYGCDDVVSEGARTSGTLGKPGAAINFAAQAEAASIAGYADIMGYIQRQMAGDAEKSAQMDADMMHKCLAPLQIEFAVDKMRIDMGSVEVSMPSEEQLKSMVATLNTGDTNMQVNVKQMITNMKAAKAQAEKILNDDTAQNLKDAIAEFTRRCEGKGPLATDPKVGTIPRPSTMKELMAQYDAQLLKISLCADETAQLDDLSVNGCGGYILKLLNPESVTGEVARRAINVSFA